MIYAWRWERDKIPSLVLWGLSWPPPWPYQRPRRFSSGLPFLLFIYKYIYVRIAIPLYENGDEATDKILFLMYHLACRLCRTGTHLGIGWYVSEHD
jgi:hypothetical protein